MKLIIFISLGTVFCVISLSCTSTPLQQSPQDSYSNAKLHWDNTVTTNYNFTMKQSCNCPSELTETLLISVRNGKISEAILVNSGSPLPIQLWAEINTVDAWFGKIEKAVSRNATRINVKYDSTLGYPKSIDIDQHPRLIDDEYRVSIKNLKILD